MSRPPYRALSFGLRLVSALIAVGGVFMILSGKPLILRVLMHPPASEVSTLLLALLKELGGVMLMVAVASLKMLDFGSLYPPYLIWGRALIRLVLAVVLFYARPRERLSP